MAKPKQDDTLRRGRPRNPEAKTERFVIMCSLEERQAFDDRAKADGFDAASPWARRVLKKELERQVKAR